MHRDKNRLEGKDDRPEFERFWPTIINVIRRYADYLAIQNRKFEDPLAHRIGYWTRVTAIGTWAAAIFAALAAIVFLQQLDMMGKQLKEARDENRAWLSVDVTAAGPITFYSSQQGPLSNLPLKIIIKNVGKTPALNVTVPAFGVVDGPLSDPGKIQAQRCEHVRDMPLDNRARGITIFPDATGSPPGPTSGAGWPPKDILTSLQKHKDSTVSLSIVGCVNYHSGTDPTPHQTGFIYRVLQIDRNTAHYGISPSGVISTVVLEPSPSTSLVD